MFKCFYKTLLLSFFFIHNLAVGEDLFRNENDMLAGDLLFDTTIRNVEIFQDFDFNGDGLMDVVAASKDQEQAEPIEILINKPPSQNFHLRYGLKLNTTLIQNSRPYRMSILSQISGDRDSLVLAADGGQIEYIQYVDDPNLSIYDRYAVHSYSLFVEGSEISNPFKRIYHAGFGDAVFEDASHQYEDATIGNDLFVIADDDFDTRLFLFERPFDNLMKTSQNLLPLASYELPRAPSHFWIGDIEKDEQQKDDIFFAYDDAW
ncbi:MAG: hypothetical protein JXR73_00140, partial [Candidatus Omnitrophica bacterium]|nr:hypothetical protein [Candidatus Omnitrophota bacterium]